ncbi:hypothetical protein CLU79DRAFT_763275 [Phycomyces nitens]|nr:hypothetical protein CLU79DRAFT_763275 [Phycomyces nitens]
MYFKASVCVWTFLWIYCFALATCGPIVTSTNGNLIQGPAYLVAHTISPSTVLVKRNPKAHSPAKPFEYSKDISGKPPDCQTNSNQTKPIAYFLIGKFRDILLKDINPPLQNAAGAVRGSVKKLLSKTNL